MNTYLHIHVCTYFEYYVQRSRVGAQITVIPTSQAFVLLIIQMKCDNTLSGPNFKPKIFINTFDHRKLEYF